MLSANNFSFVTRVMEVFSYICHMHGSMNVNYKEKALFLEQLPSGYGPKRQNNLGHHTLKSPEGHTALDDLTCSQPWKPDINCCSQKVIRPLT